MLEVLFGNKNVQRILIFLFVNEKCYGALLQRSLKTALTPIQKALHRLEKGGLITSYYEGKTRLYQFNQAYPLMTELELLLKKAYTLLPPTEKKSYYVVKQDLIECSFNPLEINKVLYDFWEKLQSVKQLSFLAKTKSKEGHGWNGKGLGEVFVAKEGKTLIFTEKGTWKGKNGENVTFSSAFRWTLDTDRGVISLENLHHGPNHPVFIFHLAPTGNNILSSVDSHLCGADSYFGQIHFDSKRLRLTWRVIGPRKNEEMDYYYFT